MSIPKYYELSGSRARDLADFRRRFKQALQKLVDVGFLSEYRVANDIVSVVREPVRHPAPLLATPAPEQQDLLAA
jgi:hypothetical protein